MVLKSEYVEGVLEAPASLLRKGPAGEEGSVVILLIPWRFVGQAVRWQRLRLEFPRQPLVMAQRESLRFPRAGMVVRGLVSTDESLQAAVPAGPFDSLNLTATVAGFPHEPPPLVELPSILREAQFTPAYDSLIGMVVVGDTDVEVLLDLVGSTEKAAVRKKVAKYVTRLEDVIARWTTIEQEVRGRAASIPPEGPKPCEWKLASVMLDGRRTTLMFEDAANEDAEHGLEAKLDTKGKLVSVDRA